MRFGDSLDQELNKVGMISTTDARNIADLSLKKFDTTVEELITKFFTEKIGPRAVKKLTQFWRLGMISPTGRTDWGADSIHTAARAASAHLNNDGKQVHINSSILYRMELRMEKKTPLFTELIPELEVLLKKLPNIRYVKINAKGSLALHSLHARPSELTDGVPPVTLEINVSERLGFEEIMKLLKELKPGFVFKPKKIRLESLSSR